MIRITGVGKHRDLLERFTRGANFDEARSGPRNHRRLAAHLFDERRRRPGDGYRLDVGSHEILALCGPVLRRDVGLRRVVMRHRVGAIGEPGVARGRREFARGERGRRGLPAADLRGAQAVHVLQPPFQGHPPERVGAPVL